MCFNLARQLALRAPVHSLQKVIPRLGRAGAVSLASREDVLAVLRRVLRASSGCYMVASSLRKARMSAGTSR